MQCNCLKYNYLIFRTPLNYEYIDYNKFRKHLSRWICNPLLVRVSIYSFIFIFLNKPISLL